MRLIATFLLVGVFCHLGSCESSNSSDATSSTAAPGPSPVSAVAATMTVAVSMTTGGSTAQTPAVDSTGSTSADNVFATPDATTATAAAVTSTGAPTSTTASKSTAAAAETATTAGLTTTTPSLTTTAKATVSETSASTVTAQTQPGPNVQLSPTSPSPVSSSSSATMSPSTRTASTRTASTWTANEINMAGKVLPSVSSLDASTSPSQATQSPAGVPPVPRTPSPSSAATSVAVSQHAPVADGKPTTSSAADALPKATAATEKGGDVKMAVFAKGKQKDEGNSVAFKVCEELMQQMEADTCTLKIDPDGNIKDASVQVNPDLLEKLLKKYDQTNVSTKGQQTDEEAEPPNNSTLIAILCSCGALLAMTAGFIAYITCHRRSYRKNQQHLTEEVQTVENGYHDNPTLEVMEPEMQEKTTTFGRDYDCSIIPLDTKDDVPEEEDTHL